jgi:hypothetical protein
MGDGFLVEFGSVVRTVECAIRIQRGMASRNSGLPEDRRMRLRMGISLGDVLVDDGDIFGDGVNIAARLEASAKPAAICLSSEAYRRARQAVDAEFDDLGECELKNITTPVRIYQLRPVADQPTIGDRTTDRPLDTAAPLKRSMDPQSIVVLPFDNLSEDPEQGYFSDGIAEDIIHRSFQDPWGEISRLVDKFTDPLPEAVLNMLYRETDDIKGVDVSALRMIRHIEAVAEMAVGATIAAGHLKAQGAE